MKIIDDPDRAVLQVILQAATQVRQMTGYQAAIYIGPHGAAGRHLPQAKIAEYAGIEIWAPLGVKIDIKV